MSRLRGRGKAMSRFYGSLQGDRAAVTRTGHRGISAHPRGWNVGVRVEGYIGSEARDTFEVRLSGGSNGTGVDRPLVTVSATERGDVRRIVLHLADGGSSVFYVDREGHTLTREAV
jgi:hypothetical protein